MWSDFIAEICDPAMPLDQAVQRAKGAMMRDSMFDVYLARSLPGREFGPKLLDDRQAERALHILDAISGGRRLVTALNFLMHSENSRLRSKAALFLARRIENMTWVAIHSTEVDSRVRANIIEGLWGIDAEEVRELLRSKVNASEPRVAGNAIFGLHLLGDPTADEHVRRLATHASAKFRATAAWVMGATGDPAWLDSLGQLARDPNPKVRGAALRAAVRLRRGRQDVSEMMP